MSTGENIHIKMTAEYQQLLEAFRAMQGELEQVKAKLGQTEKKAELTFDPRKLLSFAGGLAGIGSAAGLLSASISAIGDEFERI